MPRNPFPHPDPNIENTYNKDYRILATTERYSIKAKDDADIRKNVPHSGKTERTIELLDLSPRTQEHHHGHNHHRRVHHDEHSKIVLEEPLPNLICCRQGGTTRNYLNNSSSWIHEISTIKDYYRTASTFLGPPETQTWKLLIRRQLSRKSAISLHVSTAHKTPKTNTRSRRIAATLAAMRILRECIRFPGSVDLATKSPPSTIARSSSASSMKTMNAATHAIHGIPGWNGKATPTMSADKRTP